MSEKVERVHQQLDNDVENDVAAREMAMANQLLSQALHNEEELWWQKARINWLKSGNRNMAYFHALAHIKRNKSLIHALQNEDGRLLEDQDEIKALIVNFFSEKFSFKDHPKSDLIFRQETSGQVFSAEKSKLYLGPMNNAKKEKVKDIYGFDEGCLPTTNLGIPLVQGRVTKEILRPLVGKIKKRATGWAVNLLSLQGREVLIQSVLSSISIFSMGIYKWPTSVIKEGERILQNFLWSGELEYKKACVVTWDKVCKPFKEGGINLRWLKKISQSLMMKLTWNFLNPKDEWAKFMQAKFIVKARNFSTITKGSSIWVGVRGALEDVSAHSGWVIGDGDCINLWHDNWCSPLSLKEMINDDAIPWSDQKAKVSYIIIEGRWSIPNNLQLIFDRFGVDIHRIKINHHKPDKRVWKPDLIGKFSVKDAFKSIRNKGQPNWWFKFLFRRAIHLRLSMWGWRLCHGKLPTDDNVQKKGITLLKISSYFWELPNHDEIKININGAAKGNPGKGGIGCIFRDSEGKVLSSLAQGLGLVTNYTAECKAIIKGVELAASNGWLIAWVKSDSKSAVKAFNSDNIPWTLEAEWAKAK
ncbi:hypothetical protein GIB67_018316 [Kingdonia uniflora]|uniref:RNase H type-1 domain-containing protein n=1 Tax=Kingdonia uniflora TaxID=39325 RepID=A0A7J7MIZ1_9MAGN|nr:hypothetical protein GIB67_018316 [Kingdonia uniflora]